MYAVVIQLPGCDGLGSEKRVPCPRLTARRRRLEEESKRPAAQLGIGAYRGVGIEERFAPHGHDACLADPATKLEESRERLVGHPARNLTLEPAVLNCSGTSLT
jgi:hypothetical protein